MYYIGGGKTGSASILRGFPTETVVQWHSESFLEHTLGVQLLTQYNITLFDLVLFIAQKYQFKPLIVECVRDPVSRCISAVFQRVYTAKLLLPARNQTSFLIQEIRRTLLADPAKYFAPRAAAWQNYLGCAVEFDWHEKRFFHESENVKVLLLRFEDIDERKKIFASLGYCYNPNHQNNTSTRALIRGTRKNNVLRQRVLARTIFTRDELVQMYDDYWLKRLYSDPEIRSMVQLHMQETE